MNTSRLFKLVALRYNFSASFIRGHNYPKRRAYVLHYDGSPIAVYMHVGQKRFIWSGASTISHRVAIKPAPGAAEELVEKFNLGFLAQLEPREEISLFQLNLYAAHGEKYVRALLLSRLTGGPVHDYLKH